MLSELQVWVIFFMLLVVILFFFFFLILMLNAEWGWRLLRGRLEDLIIEWLNDPRVYENTPRAWALRACVFSALLALGAGFLSARSLSKYLSGSLGVNEWFLSELFISSLPLPLGVIVLSSLVIILLHPPLGGALRKGGAEGGARGPAGRVGVRRATGMKRRTPPGGWPGKGWDSIMTGWEGDETSEAEAGEAPRRIPAWLKPLLKERREEEGEEGGEQ